jgi:hypothetical protein
MTEQVIDVEVVDEEIVVEDGPEEALVEARPSSPSPAPGAEIAVRPPGHEVLMPMDTQQVVDGMKAYQKLLQDLLEPSDWQGTGSDKFLKKSGWRKIARAFNLSVTKIVDRVERDPDGNPLRAEATYRALAPNGQVQDGDGYCSADEKRFENAKGRQKLENDLRATATTRAKNRAISDLVGMGEVSAEEVVPGGGDVMPLATEQQVATLNAALKWLLGEDAVSDAWRAISSQCGGSMFGPVANAVIATVKARKDIETAAPEGVEVDTPPETDGLTGTELDQGEPEF